MIDTAPITFRSATFALLILGVFGVWSIVDVIDGPGTARQERTAATPTIPNALRAIPRFIADTRFHIKERYALKETFVSINGAVKRAVFNHSTAPNVTFGEHGYFFLNSHDTIGMVQGRARLSPSETDEWAEHFVKVNAAFQKTELPFYFAIAPSKHSIYPEMLPAWTHPGPINATRSHDILELAQAALARPPIDLTSVLTNAKAVRPETHLYHLTDTHWNELGAALAMRAVFSATGTYPEIEAQVIEMPRSGDMARMVGLQNALSEFAPVLKRDVDWSCFGPDGERMRIETIDPLMPQEFSCNSDAQDARKLFVFTDSFGVPAIPMLASMFKNVEFVWSDQIDVKRAASSGADLVLQIIVERKFMAIKPSELLAR